MKKILKFLTICGLFFVLILLLLFFSGKPNLYPLNSHGKAYYAEDELIYLSLSPDEKYRILLDLKDISPILINTTLIKEDQYFYFHPGFNPYSLVRAFLKTYILQKRVEGASTITMQLARLSQGLYTKNISGKLYQIWQALRYEFFYSKQEILQAYLNQAPYGGNIEGVGAASIIYFSKKAKDLTLGESAYLALIPQSPRARYYFNSQFNELDFQLARQQLLHDLDIDKSQEFNAKLLMSIWPVHKKLELPFKAHHLIRFLEKNFILPSQVNTSLDERFQNLLETKVKQYIDQRNQFGVFNASAMMVHYPTQTVKALVGSKDFFDDQISGQVDGTTAYRSPGSTLKPFIYGLGFDQGYIHPQSIIKDSPIDFALYSPENFDQKFQGPISITEALIRSRNVPAIRMVRKLRNPSFYKFLKDSKIEGLREESFYGLALALGGAEVSMHDIVKLYMMLANEGKWNELKWFASESLNQGEDLQIISPEAAFMTLDILSKNTPPHQIFSKGWTLNNLQVMWKTGTSHGFRDAWSVGIFGPYVLAVWIGNFDGSPNPVFKGLSLAAPLFFEVIDGFKDMEPHQVIKSNPPNLKRVKVCEASGQIPNSYCSKFTDTWFIPGKSPHKKCEIHREVLINSHTGLRSCDKFDKNNIKKIYEFWSSDLLELFEQAGLPRKVPPPYEADCSLNNIDRSGKVPEILSPKKGLIYYKKLHQASVKNIPLKAEVDADVRRVYWFLNENYLGSVLSDQILFVKPDPGSHILRLIDDRGRQSHQSLVIKLID